MHVTHQNLMKILREVTGLAARRGRAIFRGQPRARGQIRATQKDRGVAFDAARIIVEQRGSRLIFRAMQMLDEIDPSGLDQ